MSSLHLVPADLLGPPHGDGLYEVHEWRNAAAVLDAVYPEQWGNILQVLRDFRLYRSEILTSGGRKISRREATRRRVVRPRLAGEEVPDPRITVDADVHDSPTHGVDCLKGKVALEVEWSNKDPFFDRDLNNFRLLFDLRAIDVGVIVTRSDDLQKLAPLSKSFGN